MYDFLLRRCLCLAVLACAAAAPDIAFAAAKKPAKKPASKAASESKAADEAKHLLRYRFKAGETLRWQVEHHAQIRTTIQGTTQTAETVSTSVKVWKVDKVDANGQAKFTYSVQSVDMRQKYDGRQELHYNSDADKEAPPGFGDVAKAVGVPLSAITLDGRGKTVHREVLLEQPTPAAELITPPLPEEALAVGESWTVPADIKVTLRSGEVKKIKARQHYKLESVAGDVATIRFETQILSPVRDNPEIEVQIAQSKNVGQIRFSIGEGRILSQQSDVDERVNAFQGEASSMHCITRFSEKLLPEGAPSKAPVAGPPAGPLTRPEDAPVITRRSTAKSRTRK